MRGRCPNVTENRASPWPEGMPVSCATFSSTHASTPSGSSCRDTNVPCDVRTSLCTDVRECDASRCWAPVQPHNQQQRMLVLAMPMLDGHRLTQGCSTGCQAP